MMMSLDQFICLSTNSLGLLSREIDVKYRAKIAEIEEALSSADLEASSMELSQIQINVGSSSMSLNDSKKLSKKSSAITLRKFASDVVLTAEFVYCVDTY
jgi:hypothetical protein